MGSSDKIRAGLAYVEIGTDNNPLSAGLASASKKLEAFGHAVTSMGKMMLEVGEAIAAPFQIAALAFGKMGSEMALASARTGVTVEQLSELGYAASKAGLSLDELVTFIGRMQKTIGGAAEGSKEAEQALSRLGLSLEQLRGKSPDEQFKLIASRIAAIHDPAARARLAIEIFGRSGAQLLPLLEQGGAGIQAMEERAKSLGLTMSGESAEGALRFQQSLTDMWDVVKNTFFRVGEAVLPVLKKWADWFIQTIVKVNQFISSHKELLTTILKVAAGVIAAGAAFVVLGTAISKVGSILGVVAAAASVAVEAFTAIASVLTAGLFTATGLVVTGLAGLAAYLVYTSGVGNAVVSALKSYFGDLKDTAMTAFHGITDALAAGDWKLAADIAWAGLKLAWTQGIAPLKKIWIDLKYFGIDLWETMSNAVIKVIYKATAVAKAAWAEVVSFFKSTTNWVGDTIAQASVDADYKAKFAAIQEAHNSGKTNDKEWWAARKALEAEHDKQTAGVGRQSTAGKTENEDELNARLSTINSEEKAALAAQETLHKDKVKKNADDEQSERDAAEDDLKQKKAALKELSETAKVEARNAASSIPEIPDFYKRKQDLPDIELMSRRMFSIAGTFNANGVNGLGGGNAGERRANRMLEAAEQTSEATKEINEGIRRIVQRDPATFA